MHIAILISSLLIIFGIGCLFLAIKLHRRSLYLFCAVLFLQTGLFVLLNTLNFIKMGLPQAWPLLSIFTGVALLPAGWHRYGVFRVNYIVLSVAFVILGAILMIFALNLVEFSFAQFIRDWWFALALLVGFILVLSTLGAKHARKNKK